MSFNGLLEKQSRALLELPSFVETRFRTFLASLGLGLSIPLEPVSAQLCFAIWVLFFFFFFFCFSAFFPD